MTERIRVEVTADADDLRRALRQASGDLRGFGRDIDRTRTQVRAADGDTRRAIASYDQLGRTIGNVNRQFTFTRNVVSALKWPAYAAGAGLLAKELSAVAAGLGAIAAAGGPAIGVLAAVPQLAATAGQAAGTLKLATHGVAEALKEQTQASAQAATAATSSAGRQADAADQVANAKDTLRAAQDRAAEAQRQLTQARADARLELEQLRAASERSVLSERRAEIALREALKRRRELRNDPTRTGLGLDDADLAVDEARRNLRDTRQEAAQQARDATRLRSGGVRGAEEVRAARRALADANRAVERSTRGLADAQRDAGAAANFESAAQGNARQALDALSPAARRFVETLLEYRPLLAELRETAAEGLFPGAERGLQEAVRNFGPLRAVVGLTAEELGQLAERAGELVGSKAFGRDFEELGKRNAVILDRGGRSAMNLAEALVDVSVAAEPLTDWLSRVGLELSRDIEHWAATGRETGEAAEFFEQTREVLEVLGDILGDTATALLNVGGAGYDTGRELLDTFAETTERWRDWTGSVEGQNELRTYFQDAKPAVEETAGLIGDVAAAFVRLGAQPGTADVIHQIRADLVPAVEKLLANLSGEFGPALVDTLTAVVELFAELSEEGGALTMAVDAIGEIVKGITWLADSGFPGLKESMAVGLTGLTLYKMLGIGAAISGIQKLHGLIRATPKIAPAAAGAGAAAAGASGTAAAGAGGGAAGLAAKYLPKIGARGLGAAGAGYLAFAAAMNAINPNLDRLAEKLDTFNAPAGGDTRLKQLTRELDAAAKAGDPGRLRRVAGAIDAVGRSTDDLSGEQLREIAHDVRMLAQQRDWELIGGQGKKTSREFELMRQQTKGSIEDIRTAVRISANRISGDLGAHSARGKEALADNFRQAADQVRESMHDGTISTRRGLREIERLMAQVLRQYGFTKRGAANEAAGQRYDGGAQEGTAQRAMATGGIVTVGSRGERGHDTVPAVLNGQPAIVARGEDVAVINRHQRAVLDRRLADMGGLHGLFRRVSTPHHMASGGIVPLGRQMQRQGYHVSEHPLFPPFNPGAHSQTGWHPRGGALDVNADDWPGGEPAALDKLAARLRAAGWNILWRVADHFDHLHVDIGGGGGGPLSIAKLKRVLAKGVSGPLGDVVQAGLDKTRGAAQDRLEQLVAGMGGESAAAGGVSSAGGAYDRAALERLWIQAGGDPAKARLAAAIALAESSGHPGARSANPSGGTNMGLWQIDSGSHPDATFDPLGNARAAVRISGGGRNWGPWEVFHTGAYTKFLQRGGLIEAATGFLSGVGTGAPNQTRGSGNAKDRKKTTRPPRRRKLFDGLPALKPLAAATTALEKLDGPRGLLQLREMWANATDEDQLKTITGPDGEQIEVRDEDGIARHLAEVAELIGIRDQIKIALEGQAAAAEAARQALERGIEERVKEIERIREQVRKNRDRIRDARGELQAERKKKPKNRDQRKIGRLVKEIDALDAANLGLVGEDGRSGRLGRVRDDLGVYRSKLPDVTETLEAVPFDLQVNAAERYKLATEHEEWSGVKAPAPPTAKPDESAINALLREENQRLLRERALETGQVGTLAGFRDLLGMRLVGAFAHGIDRVRESGLAVIHKGETITPDPQGPYGSQLAGRGGAAPVINVYVDGDATPFVRQIRAEIDGRAARVVSQQLGRSSRAIAAAPGGR